MFLMKKLFSTDGLRKATTLAIALSASFFVTNNSYAQQTPCDPEYMQALEARAWLEVNREITQNQNLIAKPDSVLEYTCFNQFLNEAASNFGASRQFSETTRWGAVTGFSSTTTDTALDQIVGSAFRSYINSNFDHDYLGHRAQGNDYFGYSASVNGNFSYSCQEMARVWQLAKCTDFFEYSNRGSNPNLDGFMDFDWYRTNDPRNLPPGMSCSPPSGMYDTAINTAFNDNAPQRQANRYYLPATAEVDFNASPYDVDNVVTHLDFILFLGHPLAPSCQTVQTGITVNRVNLPVYPDAICPNPGCYYDMSSCVPN